MERETKQTKKHALNPLLIFFCAGYQRPMERATQRLLSMGAVLSGWGELAPPDPELLTRLGGCVALKGRATVLKHVDAGILDYVDLKAACAAVGAAKALPEGV